MAASKSGYVTGSWWARILIIVYGVALVMIGSQPFERQYGGFLNYLKQKTLVLAGIREARSSGSTPRTKMQSLSAPAPVKRALHTGSLHQPPKLENIREQDRRELEQLLQNQ